MVVIGCRTFKPDSRTLVPVTIRLNNRFVKMKLGKMLLVA